MLVRWWGVPSPHCTERISAEELVIFRFWTISAMPRSPAGHVVLKVAWN